MDLTTSEFQEIFRRAWPPGQTPSPMQIHDRDIIESLDLKAGQNAIPTIRFSNCRFLKSLNIRSINGYLEIEFDKCLFCEDVNFEPLISKISWNGCWFQKNLTLGGSQLNLTLSGFSIDQDLRLNGEYQIKLTINGINKDFSLGQRSLGSLILEGANFQNFLLENSKFDEIVTDKMVRFQFDANINQIEANKVKLMHANISNLLYIKGSKLGTVIVDNLLGNHRYIQFSAGCTIITISIVLSQIEQLEIFDCMIDVLRLSGTNAKTNIVEVRATTCKNLRFEEVFNEGRVSFRGTVCSEGSTISILSSTLGKAEFISCDFINATLEFENSKVTELFISEAEFPRRVVSKGSVNFSQAQLAFGQLSQAFEKQGHTVSALEYHSREIDAHYNNLSNFWIKQFPYIKPKRFHFIKFSLWLNKLSSDFGRSWIRGAAFSVGVSLVFFYCLVVSSNQYEIGWGFAINNQLVASYFRFMNPLRFFELEALFKGADGQSYLTLNWSSYVIDFFGRIAIAYGYYQTIQAFRRYGRK